MQIEYRKAISLDVKKCIDIRGATRDNAFSINALSAIGVTEDSWSPLISNNTFIGKVASTNSELIGFCFGDTRSGEILVLAVLDGYERRGIGKNLLEQTSADLFELGHTELWLAASATPVVRAFGFYRSLGWSPTQKYDINGDEILKLKNS